MSVGPASLLLANGRCGASYSTVSQKHQSENTAQYYVEVFRKIIHK